MPWVSGWFCCPTHSLGTHPSKLYRSGMTRENQIVSEHSILLACKKNYFQRLDGSVGKESACNAGDKGYAGCYKILRVALESHRGVEIGT